MSRFALRSLSCLSLIAIFLLLAGCGDSPSSASRSSGPFLPSQPPPPPPPITTFSLSGTVSAAAQSAVDADTNDPLSPLAANDLPAEAQALPNPALVGGYVTATATGVGGDRFATTADIQDWYRVELAAGQTIYPDHRRPRRQRGQHRQSRFRPVSGRYQHPGGRADLGRHRPAGDDHRAGGGRLLRAGLCVQHRLQLCPRHRPGDAGPAERGLAHRG